MDLNTINILALVGKANRVGEKERNKNMVQDISPK